MRMQVILDSSFARPGSAPIWGGKKIEFRDWTNRHCIYPAYMMYAGGCKINVLRKLRELTLQKTTGGNRKHATRKTWSFGCYI